MFQPGNQLYKNRARERRCAQRLTAALLEVDAENVPKLYRLVNALLAKALEGDVGAIKEVMDRVDGRVPQQLGSDPDNPLIIEAITRTIVRPAAFQQQNPFQQTTMIGPNTNMADPKDAA